MFYSAEGPPKWSLSSATQMDPHGIEAADFQLVHLHK
jgi:hypothetical protein